MQSELPSITCPRCGRTSHHPDDVREGYCSACHDWTSRPTLHCWEGGDRSTCMLPDGHDGPHEFTPDSEIGVKFK